MKNIFKLALIILAAVIVFTMAGCKKKPAGFVVTYKYTTPEKPMRMNDITAMELVSNIYVGWNLGNTLDANHLDWLGNYATVAQLETGWGNPITTKANIIALRNAGFNAIRLPVSWSKAADKNYIIKTVWMERIVEIVNWAIECDMYVILNTHHDEEVFGFLDKNAEESKIAFRKIWEQIAAVFRNYDERLIFEGLNEPRTPGSAREWQGGTIEEWQNINKYYQLFVDVVRASGGNNSKRMLMINPYAASSSSGAMNTLAIPKDKAKNKIIVSIHCYSPFNFALNKRMANDAWDINDPEDTLPITEPLDYAFEKFVSNNIPVIMGEFGAMNKENEEARSQWAEFFVSYAKGKGIPCFWWDNGVIYGDDAERFGLLDRISNKIIYPKIIAALMQASGAVIGEPIPFPREKPPVITLPKNQWSPGFQTQYDMVKFLDGEKITEGDEFIFEYTFKSNIDIKELTIVLVDATEKVGWWAELSEWIEMGDIKADEEISGKITLTAFETASGIEAAANKLVFDASEETSGSPTLTFTDFSVEKK